MLLFSTINIFISLTVCPSPRFLPAVVVRGERGRREKGRGRREKGEGEGEEGEGEGKGGFCSAKLSSLSGVEQNQGMSIDN